MSAHPASSAVKRAMGMKSARVNFGFRPKSLSTSAKPERDVRQERIAVRRSGGDELSADGTGGARFCLDDDRLLDDRFKRRSERTRDDFRRPAGGNGLMMVMAREG
jgi:hypothetical protein